MTAAPSPLTPAFHLASPLAFSQCDPVLKSDHVLPVLKALQTSLPLLSQSQSPYTGLQSLTQSGRYYTDLISPQPLPVSTPLSRALSFGALTPTVRYFSHYFPPVPMAVEPIQYHF